MWCFVNMQLVAYWAPLKLLCCLLYLAMPCLFKPDMHHTCLCIMPWLCLCVYHVVCFFLVLLLSSCFVAIVRIRSSTLGSASSVRLLHGLVLLPCGISGKMTATLDLTTIIAMLVASFYRYVALPITCLSSHPILPWTSNLWHLSYANHCLAMLPLLLSPSYSVASCRWSWSLFHVGTWICWDITISLI